MQALVMLSCVGGYELLKYPAEGGSAVWPACGFGRLCFAKTPPGIFSTLTSMGCPAIVESELLQLGIHETAEDVGCKLISDKRPRPVFVCRVIWEKMLPDLTDYIAGK